VQKLGDLLRLSNRLAHKYVDRTRVFTTF
jgi:hypothetical protein